MRRSKARFNFDEFVTPTVEAQAVDEPSTWWHEWVESLERPTVDLGFRYDPLKKPSLDLGDPSHTVVPVRDHNGRLVEVKNELHLGRDVLFPDYDDIPEELTLGLDLSEGAAPIVIYRHGAERRYADAC